MSQYATTDTPQDPEQLKREIARTRSDMDRTLAELEDRVSPQRIKERQTEKVRGKFQRAKDAVMGNTPDSDEVKGRAQGMADDAKDRAQGMADDAKGRAQGLADSASGTLHDASEAIQQSPQRVEQATRGNPLAAGLIAFGAGALLGSLLPATRAEEELAGELRDTFEDPVRQQLQGAGQEMKDDLQEHAQQAVEDTKQSAQQAVDRTKSQAQGAADQVQGHAKDSAQTVKDQR
ncbi:DUF3618 domain-containing protein [Egicoccus halophilus]|uniref:DUF3618 domain-containing protein n=1 Tax=Egicoccus halophilus TaxID=1670830 RepID=A0A8J3AAZ8_9ACTN|nr:DUF3618 domain-containing protein [Egicoccus halophilus]GGI06887.1 hypothetical protein GCM10011354_21340 [Egicoccus halophilus]